jgi:hypothetical protein
MAAITRTRGRSGFSRQGRIFIAAAAALAGIAAGRSPVLGVDRTYVGPASGAGANWNAAVNWTGAALPGAADNALISNADLISRTVLFDTNATISALTINQTGVGVINTLSQTHASPFDLNATVSEIIGSTGSGAYIQSSGTNETVDLVRRQQRDVHAPGRDVVREPRGRCERQRHVHPDRRQQ